MNLPADEDSGPGTDDASADGPGVDSTNAEARRAARRKLLDEVFGDVLPTVTRDELDDGSERVSNDRDQWYRDNQPPHHG